MSNRPLFDYDHIEKAMRDAKLDRAIFLRQMAANTAITVRFRGLGALVAAGLALFGHGTEARLGPTGGDSNQAASHGS
jgi:hypothetical protein